MNQKEQITDTFNNVNNLKGIVLKKKKKIARHRKLSKSRHQNGTIYMTLEKEKLK